MSPSRNYTLLRKTLSWLTSPFPALHVTSSNLSISCESSVTSLRPGSMLPFPSGQFPVRPDVSSDIASPVQPTQNRWSLTSTWVCFFKAQSEAEGKMRAHERKCWGYSDALKFFWIFYTNILYLATLSPAPLCIFSYIKHIHIAHFKYIKVSWANPMSQRYANSWIKH